jgi:hypothetical protein
VENAATMDESIWSWHCTEKTFGGNEGNQIPRCHPADKRKKDQAPRVSYCAERTENTAPENEGAAFKQTKDNRKCSAEKGTI